MYISTKSISLPKSQWGRLWVEFMTYAYHFKYVFIDFESLLVHTRGQAWAQTLRKASCHCMAFWNDLYTRRMGLQSLQ